MVVIPTDRNGMHTIEIGGLGMKGKEGPRMIMVDAVEVEVQTTVRYSVFINSLLLRWRCDVSSFFIFFRSWQKTSPVDITMGP